MIKLVLICDSCRKNNVTDIIFGSVESWGFLLEHEWNNFPEGWYYNLEKNKNLL